MSGAPSVVLGLDPGSRATGWAVVARDGGELSTRAFGVVRLDAEAAFSRRLREVHTSVRRLVVEHGPDVVVVEEAFFGKSARSALRLGEARGACVLAAALEDRTVVELAPALVKKSITGRGDADKEAVRSAVSALLGLDGERIALDASDALALAIAAHARLETAAVFGLDAASVSRSRRRGRRARWTAADVARLGRGEVEHE